MKLRTTQSWSLCDIECTENNKDEVPQDEVLRNFIPITMWYENKEIIDLNQLSMNY